MIDTLVLNPADHQRASTNEWKSVSHSDYDHAPLLTVTSVTTSLLTSLVCWCDCPMLTGLACQDGERLSPSLRWPQATYISLCWLASPSNVWNCSCSSKTLLGHLSRVVNSTYAHYRTQATMFALWVNPHTAYWTLCVVIEYFHVKHKNLIVVPDVCGSQLWILSTSSLTNKWLSD